MPLRLEMLSQAAIFRWRGRAPASGVGAARTILPHVSLRAPGMSDREESMIRSASVGRTGPLWLLVCAALSLSAHAQPARPGEIERFQRQMEQFRRETRALIDPTIPVEQRTIFDFGGYYNFNYLSLDDQQGDNRVLRQHDLVGYARLNIDGVHEFYASVRNTYEDFHSGDSFDREGDTNEFFLDRAYYRFDLARSYAAYKGEQIDYNVIFQGGRQLVYWANGLALKIGRASCRERA